MIEYEYFKSITATGTRTRKRTCQWVAFMQRKQRNPFRADIIETNSHPKINVITFYVKFRLIAYFLPFPLVLINICQHHASNVDMRKEKNHGPARVTTRHANGKLASMFRYIPATVTWVTCLVFLGLDVPSFSCNMILSSKAGCSLRLCYHVSPPLKMWCW
jgi:hypothetical protein